MNKQRITMTDNQGMFRKGDRLYKAHHYKGPSIVYEEIDVEEYDKRIDSLAKRIAGKPEVNLLDILKDALYDLSLKRLEKIEKALATEEAKPEPQIRTTKRERGTCINLAIGRQFAFKVRE